MKAIFSLLIACLLVGCATTESTRPSVYTSDSREYDIYQDGEYICKSNSSCTFNRLHGESLLEARRDGVVYGRLLLTKEKHRNRDAAGNNAFVANETFDLASSMATSSRDPLLGMLAGGLTLLALPVLFFVPSSTKALPSKITIPILEPDSDQPFPWDKPAEIYKER